MTYTYTSVPHGPNHPADHIGEEWHAYVSDIADAPAYVDGNSTGWCCHTCETVFVDMPGLTVGLERVDTPNLPGGTRIRCTMCGCHVGADHNSGDLDCLILQGERIHKNQD
jgi:hypothetical protein